VIGVLGVVAWIPAARTVIRFGASKSERDLGPLRRLLLAMIVFACGSFAVLISYANLRGDSLGWALALILPFPFAAGGYLLRRLFRGVVATGPKGEPRSPAPTQARR
jgi:hypothetical protein